MEPVTGVNEVATPTVKVLLAIAWVAPSALFTTRVKPWLVVAPAPSVAVTV